VSDGSDLDHTVEKKIDKYEDVPSSVIFEAIRRDGEYELLRRVGALWWSGVVAGLTISMSLVAKGVLVSVLPDAGWTAAVSNLGYTVGFLIVILGRMQLFTENTITPILPLFLAPTRESFHRTARLWGVVLTANLIGCLAAAIVLAQGGMLPADRFEGVLSVARDYAQASGAEHFRWGVPAGFMIAALVWTLPRVEGAGEVLMIMLVTYVVGLGGFSHVVVGSTELFLLAILGEITLRAALLEGVAPALAGNVLGGTGVFTALTLAQLHKEV
jgi:formate/nitrite transporter FocA (FNT family)